MTERPVILLYGNCQVRELQNLLSPILECDGALEVEWIRNWGDPEFSFDKVRRCCLLLWQQGAANGKLPFEEYLPANLARITFPALSCEPIWPLGPVGGDFLLERLKAKGLAGEALLSAYQETDLTSVVNLDRMWEIYSTKVRNIEERTTIKIYDTVLPTISNTQHFWMPIHPSHLVLLELGKRIAGVLNLEIPQHLADRFLLSPILGGVQVPVHPQVAKHFDISWADSETKYLYDDGKSPGQHFTYQEYLRRKVYEVQQTPSAA